MSFSHLVILGIIILIVVPPEKLPEIMRTLGRFVNDLKRQTNGIFSQVTDEFKDVKKDLTPDIRLTPGDMLKKLQEHSENAHKATVAPTEDTIKKDDPSKPDQKS